MRDAGIIIPAVPTVIIANGKVARFLSGAICKPTTPESVMTNMDAVWNNACEVNRRYTLFHFIFAVIILKFMMQNWQFVSGCLL